MPDKPYQIGWAQHINSTGEPTEVFPSKQSGSDIAIFASPVGHQDIRIATLREINSMLIEISDKDNFAALLQEKLKQAESIVTFDDTRMAGRGMPHKCFYCSSETGTKHQPECVCLTKKVTYRVIMDLTTDEPASWDKDTCERARNEGSWCADNIDGWIENHREQHGCLCGVAKFEVINMAGQTSP